MTVRCTGCDGEPQPGMLDPPTMVDPPRMVDPPTAPWLRPGPGWGAPPRDHGRSRVPPNNPVFHEAHAEPPPPDAPADDQPMSPEECQLLRPPADADALG